MGHAGTQTFTLVISGTADRPAGSLHGADGLRHAFTGWLGLAAALEAALGWGSDQPGGPGRAGISLGDEQQGA